MDRRNKSVHRCPGRTHPHYRTPPLLLTLTQVQQAHARGPVVDDGHEQALRATTTTTTQGGGQDRVRAHFPQAGRGHVRADPGRARPERGGQDVGRDGRGCVVGVRE
jgi:hypothetical protein